MAELMVTVVVKATLSLPDPVLKPDDPGAAPPNVSIEQQVLERLAVTVSKLKDQPRNDVAVSVDIRIESMVKADAEGPGALECNESPLFEGVNEGVLALFQDGAPS